MSDQTTIKHSIVKPVVKSATPKGQLISKGIFGVYKSTYQKTNECYVKDFCPSPCLKWVKSKINGTLLA